MPASIVSYPFKVRHYQLQKWVETDRRDLAAKIILEEILAGYVFKLVRFHS